MELKIGESIKFLRGRDGRTQEHLANALGITAQAVSRWESGAAYPDMELVPSIANYFGVSIDELFGYRNERQVKVKALIQKIREADRANNGEDVCIDACIQMARNGLAEFPGNQDLLLCLAGLLYNAGYARHGEHHLTSPEGYDIYDVEHHRTYAEWREAKHIYEKLVKQLDDGPKKREAVLRLTQLCAVTGETEEVMALIEALPDISGSRDVLILNAYDGKRRLDEYNRTISKLLFICANLICSTVMMGKVTSREAVERINTAIGLLESHHVDHVAVDDGLTYHGITGMYLYLSVFLWREGDHDGAFGALDAAYSAAKAHDQTKPGSPGKSTAADLPAYWPCCCVPDYRDVEKEIKSDSRWTQWVQRCGSDCE